MNRKNYSQIIFISIFLLAILILVGCNNVKIEATPTSIASETTVVSQTVVPTAEPSATPDLSVLGENIMLIGVDYAPERDTWGGKHMYHADIMMVLHIDSETGKVSIISLPKDIYSNIPGVTGIYKLNASLNCGGDWPSQSACEKVCEAASWTIGGLPINYYYAVDMTAAKDLVDEINGIDFDLDVSFTINERSYTKGFQHMDGQAVLDYLRVRDNGIEDNGNSDGNQTQRQQRMMLAILQNLKDSGQISQLPAIINDFTSNHLVTNTSLAQTMALAICLKDIDLEGKDMEDIFHAMDGQRTQMDNLGYIITDAEKRIQIIQDVYGIDITDQDAVQKLGISVPSYADYSYTSTMQLWENMQIYVVTNQAKGVLDNVNAKLDSDAHTKYLADGEEWTLYNQCEGEYEQLANWDISASSDFAVYNDVINSFKADIESLCGMFSIAIDNDFWDVIYNPYDGEINQPYVQNQIAVDPR